MFMSDTLIESIVQRWFITEPALFSIYCTHHFETNSKMSCVIRTGHGVIEYNPHLMPKGQEQCEELLKSEMIRIMLKHPYERQPQNVRRSAIAMASDVVLSDNIDYKWQKLISPMDLGLERGRHFEWYAHEINELMPEMKSVPQLKNEECYEDMSELWEEDEFMTVELDNALKQITDWGTLPGKAVALIKASLEAKIDYRKVLAGFRASILSSKRSLTRMRPSRRFQFDAMGSKYDMVARLLVAVDVSGSISDTSLAEFFGVISKFFKYGITTLDIIQFDTELKNDIITMDKSFRATQQIKILGRGGTSYQPVINYIHEHKQYDGLIVFTDGDGAAPRIDFATKTKLLWVCQNKNAYNRHHSWMEKTGRACYVEK